MNAYLKKIQLSNYRSCRNTTLDLHPNLSTFIGVNGSGKSNVLNGITLLNKILRSRHYYEQGNIQSVCKIKTSFEVNNKTIKYEAVIRYTTNDRNIDEVFDATEKWNFFDFTDDNEWIKVPILFLSEYSARRTGYPRQLTLFENQRPLRSRLFREFQELIPPKAMEKISVPMEEILNLISGTVYYSASQFTDPSKCPTYFEIDRDRTLHTELPYGTVSKGSRSEHTQFMRDLFLTYKNKTKKFQEFMSIVGKNGINLIDKIIYKEVKAPSRKIDVYAGGKIVRRDAVNLLIIPTITVKGVRLSPNQLSEGTFKTLAIIFYLVTDESRVLLLEEPEVCVHHGLLGSIMQLVKDFSSEKQIIISTHSDFVLDGLDPSNVFVVKYQPDKGTVVKHVPSAMSKLDYKALKEYLNNDGNLGEYWRHGDLENDL